MEREYFEKFEFKSDHLSSISLSLYNLFIQRSVLGRSATRVFDRPFFFFFLISRLSLDLYYFSRWKLGSFFLFSSFFPLYYFFLFFFIFISFFRHLDSSSGRIGSRGHGSWGGRSRRSSGERRGRRLRRRFTAKSEHVFLAPEASTDNLQ